MSPPDAPRVRPALLPLSWLYAAWIERRNSRYDRAGLAGGVDATVVSVGNLSVGGTGKTPLVRWLAERMIARAIPTAIVSRGYRGRAGAGPLVVSTGHGPSCASTVSGDEPWMLARAVPEAIVVVGSNRRAGARRAVELGARLILLDDGFQHRALARDLDVVLVDRSRPFDRDRLLPAGTLREPAASLARADWIVISRSPSPDGAKAIVAACRAAAPQAQVLHADHRATGFSDAAGRPREAPARAVAFCAIGHPERFRADVERLGVSLVAFHALRDHRVIGVKRLRRWKAEAQRREAVLLTTEKDLARIGPETAARFGVAVLAIETVVPAGDELLDLIHDLVRKRPSTSR